MHRTISPLAASCGTPTVLVPVFNDWASLGRLLTELDSVLAEHGVQARVLVVDDGSTVRPPTDLGRQAYRSFLTVEVLQLRRNLGHERAIAIGLAYCADKASSEPLVLMDGDGEDDPRDVPRLLECFAAEGYSKIVFAERTIRSENRRFRLGYHLYRIMHQLLTGKAMRVGSFSVVPSEHVQTLTVTSEIWSHYAAAVFRSRLPRSAIPTTRGSRYFGKSHLDLVGLVTHGLSAIAVHADVVGVRLLIASLALILLTSAGIVATLAIKLLTDLAIPGWATNVIGLLLIILVQAGLSAVAFSFMILGSRQSMSFVPRRDYVHFVGPVERIFSRS